MSDSKELSTDVQQGGALAATGDSQSLLAMIADATMNPAVDAGKMQAVTQLAIQLQDRERQQQFNRDKVQALLEMPVITKRGRIVIPSKVAGTPDRVQSRYAKFEHINAVVKPILAEHNLAISFKVGHAGPAVLVTPVLEHRNGLREEGEQMQFPIDNSGNKNPTQGVGSASSYGKRQAMKAMLNIVEVDEDDDGHGGGVESPERLALAEAGQITALDGPDAFAEWFKAQSTQDRAWLVQHGHKARLQGLAAKALNPPPAELEAKATRYETNVGKVATRDDLIALQTHPATLEFMAQLDADWPVLAARIREADRVAFERLSADE